MESIFKIPLSHIKEKTWKILIDKEDLPKIEAYEWTTRKLQGKFRIVHYPDYEKRPSHYYRMEKVILGINNKDRIRYKDGNSFNFTKRNLIWGRLREFVPNPAYDNLETTEIIITANYRTRSWAIVDIEDREKVEKHNWFLVSGRGEPMTKIGDVMIVMAKIVLGLDPDDRVKYLNKNRKDCRKENLLASTHQKQHFAIGLQKNNSSGYKGVSYNKNAKKWSANIRHNGKQKFLGYHFTPEAAARAYNKKAKELFGEDAFLNEIPENSQ